MEGQLPLYNQTPAWPSSQENTPAVEWFAQSAQQMRLTLRRCKIQKSCLNDIFVAIHWF